MRECLRCGNLQPKVIKGKYLDYLLVRCTRCKSRNFIKPKGGG